MSIECFPCSFRAIPRINLLVSNFLFVYHLFAWVWKLLHFFASRISVLFPRTENYENPVT